MKIEKARFQRIDKDFRYLLNTIYSGDQRVVSLCRIANLRYTLDTLIQQLGICQKSLNEYLEVRSPSFSLNRVGIRIKIYFFKGKKTEIFTILFSKR